jgi:hypothetical protein
VISDILGLGVCYRCDPVSDYHVGFISEYIKRGSDKELVSILERERERLGYAFEEMTRSGEFKDAPADMRLEKYIKKPTFRITFEMWVQRKYRCNFR